MGYWWRYYGTQKGLELHNPPPYSGYLKTKELLSGYYLDSLKRPWKAKWNWFQDLREGVCSACRALADLRDCELGGCGAVECGDLGLLVLKHDRTWGGAGALGL